MIQALLQTASFLATPFFVIIRAKINDIFAGDEGLTAGRREHFMLHHALDFARDAYKEFLPDATGLPLLVNRRERVSARLPINPPPNGFQ
jgi:hypothetical protein